MAIELRLSELLKRQCTMIRTIHREFVSFTTASQSISIFIPAAANGITELASDSATRFTFDISVAPLPASSIPSTVLQRFRVIHLAEFLSITDMSRGLLCALFLRVAQSPATSHHASLISKVHGRIVPRFGVVLVGASSRLAPRGR